LSRGLLSMGLKTESRRRFALLLAFAGGTSLSVSGCAQLTGPSHAVPVAHTQGSHAKRATTPVSHVVVIVQENRSVDNIFNGFPGADTSKTGFDSHGNQHTLRPISFSTQCDPLHSHQQFVSEYNDGAMNGWNNAAISCRNSNSLPDGVFAYVSNTYTAAYWAVAGNYAFADEVFQTNEGPSLPAHQYLIAGQSGGHSFDAPWALSENGGSSSSRDSEPGDSDGSDVHSFCGSGSNVSAVQIDLTSSYPGTEGNPVYPCKEYQTIFDLAMAQGLTWKYYTHRIGSIWSGVDAVQHLWANPAWHAIAPETTVLTDIAHHQLANIVYVTPSPANSDHPHAGVYSPYNGPKWVASVVNAIGRDPFYWGNTTILIVWDDWGGWFDHVPAYRPFSNDPYMNGFRVPLIAVSPYVIANKVDHTQRTFDSILTYIESTFGLGSLGMQDANTDDLSNMFDYSQAPLQFVPMAANGRADAARRKP
jgi:phospholipase C